MEASPEIVELRASPAPPLFFLVGAAAGLYGAAREHPWVFYLGLAGLALGVADFLWQRRNPIVRLSPSGIVIRLGLASRERRLAYAEVAGWAHSTHWIGFETFQSKRIYLPLQALEGRDRVRLVKQLQALHLGQPGFASLSPEGLERRHIKRVTAGVVFTVAVIAAVFLWFFYRNMAAPPAACDAPYPAVRKVNRMLSVSADSDGVRARSAIAAVRRAAPFAPLPAEAGCLARVPITATFANPGNEP